MPGKINQAGKLRRIGWLMLASELLLCLFLIRWVAHQYQEERTRMDKEVQQIFMRVDNRIADSLLNQEVSTLLQDKPPATDTFVQFQFNTVAPSEQLMDKASGQALQLSTDTTQIPAKLTAGRKVSIHSYTIATDSGKEAMPAEKTKKVLRFALQQIINDIDQDTLLPQMDTALLRQQFMQDVHKKWPATSVRWYSAGDSLPQFVYQSANSPQKLLLSRYGYYVLKNITPQIVFGIVLLLMTSLAFILAYRNSKQQTIFSLQKDQFISNISHELKTPVATTKVAIEALSVYDGMDDPQRSRRYLRMAGWEINRLETMINKIMDLHQAANEVLNLDFQLVDLKELVHEIVLALQQEFIERGTRLDLSVPDEHCPVWADRTHLTGAIYNLIDNAIKYGRDLVSITVVKHAGNIQLSVMDNGPGIPEAYRSKIFEQFVRVPQGNIHNVKGYGLGLSYARYIIEAHNGRLWLEPDKGQGTLFCISLPQYLRK